jgi:hypothetical protein
MSWPLPSGTRWHSSCQNSFQLYMRHNWWTVPHVHTLINGPAVCSIPMHVSILAHLLEEPCQQVPHNFYFKHCSYDTWNSLLLQGFPLISFLSHCYHVLYFLCSCFRFCLFFYVFAFLPSFSLLAFRISFSSVFVFYFLYLFIPS